MKFQFIYWKKNKIIYKIDRIFFKPKASKNFSTKLSSAPSPNPNPEQERNFFSWKLKLILFCFFMFYVFSLIFFLYAAIYAAVDVHLSQQITQETMLVLSNDVETFRPLSKIKRDPLIQYFIRKRPHLDWTLVPEPVFVYVYHEQVNVLLFVEGFFQNHPELLVSFIEGDAETRLKIFNQIIKEFKRSGLYDCTKVYSEEVLQMCSENVRDAIEKRLNDPNTKDYLSQYIKIVKIEKKESWDSFWSKIWKKIYLYWSL